MRPKVVIFTLIAAFAVLGLVAVLKGVKSHTSAVPVTGGPNATATATPASTDTNAPGPQLAAGASNAGQPSDELRAAVIQKEIDEIQNLQAAVDGSNNQQIIDALVAKISNPEAEVRKAALEAIKQLNDTNAVAGLQRVANQTQDAHEKVAILDTIDYLNMPSITSGISPEYATNNAPYVGALPTEDHMNKVFVHKAKRHSTRQAPGGTQTPPAQTDPALQTPPAQTEQPQPQ